MRELSEEERQQLRDWRVTLWELDPRYGDKKLLVLAGMSLANEEIRAKLIADPQSVMAEFGIALNLLESTTVRFVENTADTLTVILPARPAELEDRPESLNSYLESRLTKVKAFLRDDFDWQSHAAGDIVDHPDSPDHKDSHFEWGDPDTRDHPPPP
ncbi:nitrile hydratase subunit alpha [Streptomyces sp. JHA19]|uniref:nitrile hydratase subunit alpha n=1 Tax=Streptomyces sp. JHA19 TaxID=1577588 RepID=UPI0006E1A7F6|nr:nitrile hydratase subunit alpha [Streptomyces sp. JHA19]